MIQYPIHNARRMRVICIGAGASGLCFAYKLQRSFSNFELVIYERNAGISGSWFENTYPGCACDFPAHNYTYSFEPQHISKNIYSGSAEVRRYFEAFAERHSLNQFVRLEHSVESARWQESTGIWELSIQDLRTKSIIHDNCNILVNASGVLSTPELPDIPDIESFDGLLFHTARWPQDLNLSNHRVGLIGNGSSGQQLLPAIQPIAKQITHFVRQGAWSFGPWGDPSREWTKEELLSFQNDPNELLAKRKQFEVWVNSAWAFLQKGSEAQEMYRGMVESTMQERTKDRPDLQVTIPTFSLGCQRPVTGPGYLEALQAQNVSLVFGEIEAITPKGIRSFDGREHKLDVLICATGFKTSYVPPFSVIQQDGKNLQDVWDTEVNSYMATTVAKCPNYFTIAGPMNPWGSGTFLNIAETQSDYILKFCNRWQTENIHSFVPKEASVAAFMKHARKVLQNTVWTDSCRSWFKNHTFSAEKLLAWPGSGLHFREALADPRYEDYEFSYVDGDSFAWLGNGFSQVEMSPDGDRAYYLRLADDSPLLGRSKMHSSEQETSLPIPS